MDTLTNDICEQTEDAQGSTLGPAENGQTRLDKPDWWPFATETDRESLFKILDIIICYSHRSEDQFSSL